MVDKSDKPTIQDVAKEAEVAKSTVSRVINGLDRVSPATRKKVKDAVRKLDFYPNSRAQAFGSKRTGMIGLLVPDFEGQYFTGLMGGAFEQAKDYGINIMVLKAKLPEERVEVLKRLREEERVDGVIMVFAERYSKALNAIGGNFENLVILDKDVGRLRLDNVFVDNLTGSFEAARHLLDVHKAEKIFYAGGGKESIDVMNRAQGFTNALVSAGMEIEGTKFFAKRYGYDDGYSLAQNDIIPLIKKGGFNGIVAANDQIACGVIDALVESGFQVPEEVGVIGFDDSRLAIWRNLKLTTVRNPVDEMGAEAVKMIVNRLSEDSIRSGPSKLILRTELIVRQSCGCGQHD